MTPADLLEYSHAIAERHAATMVLVDQIEPAPTDEESSDLIDQQADAYAEGLFFRVFTNYENDIEKLFLHYVTGGASLKGGQATSYLNVENEKVARKLIRAGWRFLSWGKPEKIRETAQNYIQDGWPICVSMNARSQELSDCERIRNRMGAALLRRRPEGLLPAARQELLDPSKAWWGGRRGRLADRPRYFISVSLGVVPLVLPRRGSPSTHRGRGWLRSTRSFRTASAPTQLATRRIRTRAWMKQRYWVAPACTSELHHGRGPGTARPFDDAGGDGTQAPPADVLGHLDEVDYHTVRSTAALARLSCVSAPSTSATRPGAQPAPSRRSSPGGVPADAAASARHRRPPRPDRRPPPGCVDRGVLAGACASTPGPVGAAPVRARSHSSAGLRAMRGRLWHQRRRPRPPHTAPGRGERRCQPRLASLNSPATAGPCWAPHRHGGSVGPCDLDRWWHPTRPRRHVPRTSSSLLRPSQRHLPSQGTVSKRRANVQGGGGDDRSVRAP